jgi:homoserine/homoserine lactone efflux protein
MDLAVWLYYLLATIILSLTPGPGVFSSISSGLHHGVRLGVWNAIGMQAANLVYVAVVALGLGAILLASETLFEIIKWLGVAYLIYLGVVTWRSKPPGDRSQLDAGCTLSPNEDDHARTAREIFTHGFLVNITNPKGIIFFAAIFPQFVDVARPLAVQYVILGATTLVTDLVIMTAYIALAAKVFRALREPSHLRWVNRGLGSIFVTAGLALAAWRK